MLLGQSRVFFSMSRDGLVPRIFSEVHPRYRTPWKSNMLFFVFTGLLAAFVPADVTGEMTSIGTLFAFSLVCAGVWIMRVKHPDLEPRSRRAARRDSRHHHLWRDDLWTRLDKLDAIDRMAADRLHLLLWLRQEPQSDRRAASNRDAGRN